jgi:hypothetical protein
MIREVITGAAAGAAGTTALNAVTYADMALRGRSASTTPEDAVNAIVERLPGDVPGSGDTRANRVAGLAPLMGLATGVAIGASYGLASRHFGTLPRWAASGITAVAAMTLTNGPMAGLGITDPRGWTFGAWIADVVPHAAYGLVTVLTFDEMQPKGDR